MICFRGRRAAAEGGEAATTTAAPAEDAATTTAAAEGGEAAAGDKVEIEFWHAMADDLGVVVDDLVNQYNTSQDAVQVNSTFQGSYDDTFNASFFSGHASESATLAGLLCARHLHRRERGRLDLAICGAAVAASAATGVLRISADQHWATDVLVGWISGGIFGYVLPSLIDYRGEPDSAAGRTLALLRHLEPMPRPATWGLRASFRF